MLFSVVIPVYNVESYLRDCLNSVVNQTFTDWEAICVNDGSTDGSAAVLEEYADKDSRLKIITQPNAGLSAARNTGMKTAHGEYVLFLDSDDWLESHALETLAQNLDGEDMLCYSGRRYTEQTKTFHQPDALTEGGYQSGMDYYNANALLKRDFAFVCVVLRAYKRSFLIDNKLWFKEGIYHEDNHFTPLACYHAHKVRVINDCLYDYRLRKDSISTTVNLKHLYDLLGTANDLAAFFVVQSGFDKTTVYRAITHHYQRVFMEVPAAPKKEIRSLCDWGLYRKVSRTKLRHRWNYLKNRIGL